MRVLEIVFMEIKAELYFEGWIYGEISRVILRGMGFMERWADLYLEVWDLWRDKQCYIERDGIYGEISRVVLRGMGFMER